MYGEPLDRDDAFLRRELGPLHYLVFKFLNIMLKKQNGIISFIKSKPILFTIGSVGIIAATIIIGEQGRKLNVLGAGIKDCGTEKQQQLPERENTIDVLPSKSE